MNANDIVKICALSDRRQLADVPRVPRAHPHRGRRTAPQRAGHADQRGLHLRHDAPQAAPGAEARVHRRLVRSARTHLSRRPRRRLQSEPRADARRARAADSDGARRVRSDGRADPHLRALRGRRCDRDADAESRGRRVRGRHRDDGQGLLSARRRRRQGLQPARRRELVRRGGRQGEIRRRPRSRRRRAGADGRHDRQHQGRAGRRREGRARADRAVRIAREPARACGRGEEQAVPRGAAREHGSGAAEPRARAHPRRRACGLQSRGPQVSRRLARTLLPDLQRARLPDARGGSSRRRPAPSRSTIASSTASTASAHSRIG